jgi:hypothetical protein
VAGVVDGQAQGYAVGTAVDDSRLRFFERMARQQDYNALAKGQSTLGGAAWQQTMQRGHFERPVRLTTTSWGARPPTTETNQQRWRKETTTGAGSPSCMFSLMHLIVLPRTTVVVYTPWFASNQPRWRQGRPLV